MIVRIILRLAVFAIMAALFPFASAPDAAACDARIVSQKEPAAEYDPFAPVDHVRPGAVTIENTSAADCIYALTLSPSGDVPDLRFELRDAQGDLLAADGTGSALPGRLVSPPLAQGESYTFHYDAVLPAGQLLAPGHYEQPLDLLLTGNSSQPPTLDAPPMERVPGRLVCTVADRLSVNIAGAGTFTTVDFGVLAEGEARRVIVEARGNRNFNLEISSRNGAALTLKTPGRSWHIGYSVAVNGAGLTLPARIGPFTVKSVAGTSFDFSFTIGDVSAARAGLYTDEVTVEIRPAI